MPPVIGVAIAQALVAAGVTAGTAALVGAGITAVLSVAMSFAISSLTPKPTFNRAGIADLSQDAHPRTVMVRSSIEPHRIVYGRALVSGPLLFSGASGENNKYLHLIIALAGHEVYAIDTVYLNDDESTDSRIAALVRITKHLGTDDQEVDADWIADFPDLVETTDRLRGIAYLYVRLEWDSQVWLSGVPNIRAVVRGRKIYDVRDGLTRWSTNAALCQRDYLTAGFGLGASTDDLDEVFWLAAANICAEQVPTGSGGVQFRYRCNGTFQLDQRPIDIMEDLLSASAGTLVYCQGKYRGFAGAYDPPTTVLTEDDLRGPVALATRTPRRELVNTVKGLYVDPMNYWQPAEFSPMTNSDYTDADGAELVTDIQLPFTTSPIAAQRIAKIHLERSRRGLTVSFPAKLTALRVAPWDVVQLHLPRFGLNYKPCRVLASSFTPDAGIDLSLREEDDTLYSWAAEEATVDAVPDADLPSPWVVSAPTGLTLSSGTGIKVTSGGNTVWRIRCTWDATVEPYVLNGGSFEIQFRESSEAVWTAGGFAPGEATELIISPVMAGSSYDVRIRAINTMSVYSDWLAITGHLVADTILRVTTLLPATEGATAGGAALVL